jgi:quercetin dioxygenase-like cupin family protein
MSEPQVVPFPAAAFEPAAPGIASRAVLVNGVRWALVQYEPGVLREEWCEEGHSGYVLEGAVTYEFRDGGPALAVRGGEGFTLPDGSGHRGRAGADGVRLFLIDRAG